MKANRVVHAAVLVTEAQITKQPERLDGVGDLPLGGGQLIDQIGVRGGRLGAQILGFIRRKDAFLFQLVDQRIAGGLGLGGGGQRGQRGGSGE